MNSTGKDLDLSSGNVAKAIAAKAGHRNLQAACSAIAPLTDGEVKDTPGFQLPCKKVFHCLCPHWNGAQSFQVQYGFC